MEPRIPLRAPWCPSPRSVTIFNLGRHVEHDPRSRDFAFSVSTPLPEVDTFWPDSAPVLNQGDVGGCVGWTGADLLNTDAFASVRKAYNKAIGAHPDAYLSDADGLKFYEAATKADGIPGYYLPGDPNSSDTGSSGLGLAKALKKLGLITRYTHAPSWDAFVQAILRQPIAFGSDWTTSMFKPDSGGVVHVGVINDSTLAGGHEYMGRGISFSRGLVLWRNHWTPTWNPGTQAQKLPGEFWTTFADTKKLLANQGDVTVLHGIGMP